MKSFVQQGFKLDRHRVGGHGRRQGMLLVIVLVTVVILSLSVYTFTALMQTEEEASRLGTRQLQSKNLVDSGMDFVRLYLSNSEATIREKGGRWDNPTYFQAVPVAVANSDAALVGYFSVATSSLDEEGAPEGQRFGLIDESSKINLNTMPYAEATLSLSGGNVRDLLMGMPEMTEEIADSILDWMDADDDSRDYGVESAYYEGLSPPYSAKNGPLDSMDELLLIYGVTPQLLFGLDTNRNGILDPAEMAGTNASSTDAEMYLGWANYLTLYSNESNLTAEGLPRINVNADDLEQLYDDLKSAFDDEWANFIIYYRCSSEEPTTEPPSETAVVQSAALLQPDFAVLESKRKLTSIVDLVTVYVDTSEWDELNLTSFAESPVKFSNVPFTMPRLMASLTTFEGATIPGRINIMQ
ncbi:general secretion pathway protein GspK, partial [bacterium]|nr:general secretion pathway protein GspK [bacterium]